MFLAEENVAAEDPTALVAQTAVVKRITLSARKPLDGASSELKVCPVVADVRVPELFTSSGLVLGDITACLYLLDFSFPMFSFSFDFETGSHAITQNGL